MRTSQIANEPRTFRSGPYLHSLLRSAERMDERLQAEICARIKQARIEAGFTQEEAADVLGMTQRGYQNYEAIRVPFRKLSRIAEVFNVEEKFLLYGQMTTRGSGEADDEIVEIGRRLGELEETLDKLDRETARGFESLEAAIAQLADRLRPPGQAGESL